MTAAACCCFQLQPHNLEHGGTFSELNRVARNFLFMVETLVLGVEEQWPWYPPC